MDLVEQDKHFLEKARDYLSSTAGVGTLYCAGLQNFSFPSAAYNVVGASGTVLYCTVLLLYCTVLYCTVQVWCQWVLGHLTEEHLVQFFQRAAGGLVQGE